MDFIHLIAAILGVLLSISEILGTFSYFKSSSIFELVVGIIKKAVGILPKE